MANTNVSPETEAALIAIAESLTTLAKESKYSAAADAIERFHNSFYQLTPKNLTDDERKEQTEEAVFHALSYVSENMGADVELLGVFFGRGFERGRAEEREARRVRTGGAQ